MAKSRLRTTTSMSNTGYHQNGRPAWWAYTRANGKNTFIEIKFTRGDNELDCIVDLPAGTTVYCGAGKGTHKTVRQTVVTESLPEEKKAEEVKIEIVTETVVEEKFETKMPRTADGKIDANKMRNFPKGDNGRPHYITIPQPQPVMTDEERDAYVAENVAYPENWQIVSVYAVRESAESKDFQIQIGFRTAQKSSAPIVESENPKREEKRVESSTAVENYSKLDQFGSGTITQTYDETDIHGNTRTVYQFSHTSGYGNDNTTLETYGNLHTVDGAVCLMINVVKVTGMYSHRRLGTVIKHNRQGNIVVGDSVYVHPTDVDFSRLQGFEEWASQIIAEKLRAGKEFYEKWEAENAEIDWAVR